MNKKITLKDFLTLADKGIKAAIHCDTEEKAKKLLTEFDKMGERWFTYDSYEVDTRWEDYKKETCYSNCGGVAHKDWYEDEGYAIYEFEDIFSENNLIKSITLNDKKKITTVVFTDGDVKMVKCGENDTYSPETGIVYCMALKYSGLSKTQFKKMIDKFIPKGKASV